MARSRREFFETVGAGAAGLAIGMSADASAAAGATPAASDDGPILQVGDNIAVADTTYGKVRGYILRGIHYFLGMPYGADTSGAEPLHATAEAQAVDGRLPGAVVGQLVAAEHGEPLPQRVRRVPGSLELRRRQRGLPADQRLHARAQATGRSAR